MTRRRTTLRWLMPLCLVMLCGSLALPATSVAAGTQLVTDCGNTGTNTLRGRIAAAAVGDTILFNQDCTGGTAITLASTLTLTKNVTIDGTGHTVVVDGNSAVTVVTVNAGLTVGLSNLTIQHGKGTGCLVGATTTTCGGGIYHLGTMLTVTNCTIANSAAGNGGGIFSNGGTLTLTNSIVSGNGLSSAFDGGGIYSQGGTLTLTNSTLSGNSANNGGGIDLESGSMLTMTGSTLSGNTVVSSGAAAGIFIGGGSTAVLTNSTLSGNTANPAAGGTIYNDHATLTVMNSTFSGNIAPSPPASGFTNGADIDVNGGSTTVTNTVTASSGQELKGSITSGGHNLFGTTSGASVSAGAGDIVNPATLVGTLGSYSGPTQTVPLLPGSPAIGGGASGAGIPTTDQRGVVRTGHTDIGAFQSQGFSLVKTGGDNQSQQLKVRFSAPLALTVTATAAGAPWNEPVLGGVLTVMPPGSGASVSVTSNPALPANGQASIALTANATAGGPYTVTVGAGGTITQNFSLTNLAVPAHTTYTVGTTTDHFGGQTSAATCRTGTNTTCALRDAVAYATSGTDTIVFKSGVGPKIALGGGNGSLILNTNVTITGPGASSLAVDGGCTGCGAVGSPSGGVTVFVVNSGVTASISGLTIQHGNATALCNTTPCGGGIHNDGTLSLTNSTVSGNSAVSGQGGGIYNSGTGTLTVTASTISGNSVTGIGIGGGIENGGTLTVTASTVSGNSAPNGHVDTAPSGNGGGIYNELRTVTVTDSTISDNSGGGLLNFGTLAVTNSIVSGNSDGGISNGGSLFNVGFLKVEGNLTVTNSTFSGNSAATSGGGINNIEGSWVSVTNSTFSGNSATGNGGGINNDWFVPFPVRNTIVAGNSATGSGPDTSGPLDTGGRNLIGGNPLLGPLGSNSGPTQTFALLPGSPAIDAGDDTICTAPIPTDVTQPLGAGGKDQRGITRPQGTHCDLGAYEARFTLTVSGGTPQSTLTGQPFATPLSVTLSSQDGTTPLSGAPVTFTARGSGASATITGSPATTNASGAASVTATANGTAGGYNVTANAPGAAAVTFNLTNTTGGSGITGISPSSGSTAGGNPVTLTGTGFGTTANTQVLLDGTAIPAANITSVTATQIVYLTPSHAAGDVTVTVKVGGVALAGSEPYTYTASSSSLTGINPSSGSIAGGNQVTLAGAGFGTTANTQVLIGGVAIPTARITSVTGTQIVYVAPAHAAGSVTVTVSVGGTTLAGSVPYQYVTSPPATLTGITPSSGSTAGGTSVTLTGTGFGTTATTQVLLDGTAIPSANLTSVTGTQIVYLTPAHAAGSVTMTVTVSGTPLAGSVTYTYLAPTTSGLTGIIPSSGSTVGGTSVTLSGAGFGTSANTQVLIDGVALPTTSVTSVIGTQIVYIAPAHAAGSVVVTVTVDGTTLAGSATYTYYIVELPGGRATGGTGGSPAEVPGSRPTGTTGGTAPITTPSRP